MSIIQEYIERKKELQICLLEFIDCAKDDIGTYQQFLYYYREYKIDENQFEIKKILYLIQIIIDNHHRSSKFFNKIEQILVLLKNQIKRTFSNFDLFIFFINNKRIILFLIENEFITLDKNIITYIFETKNNDFIVYFSPEIKPLIDEMKTEITEKELSKIEPDVLQNLQEKRKSGENDSFLCQLIRDDLIDDFISHVTHANIQLSKTTIKHSIYETNLFLMKKNEVTLIEYAAFYGSIQIFNYLRMNKIQLTSSLWLYAIHGRNAEIIHLLEQNHIWPEDKTFNECLKESIKCHHNEIASYIQDNLMNNDFEFQNDYNENVFAYGFRYFNYFFFPTIYTHKYTLCYFCQYDYLIPVKLLLNDKSIDINDTVIQTSIYFLNKIQNFEF